MEATKNREIQQKMPRYIPLLTLFVMCPGMIIADYMNSEFCWSIFESALFGMIRPMLCLSILILYLKMK